MVARRVHVPIQTACETRKALERGRYIRLAPHTNLRSTTPTDGEHDDIERGTRPRARRASRHMPGRPSFDPKPASRPRLKLTSASPRVLAGFGSDGCRWCKWWLQFHIWLLAAWPACWHGGNGSSARCRARESAARSRRKRPSGAFSSTTATTRSIAIMPPSWPSC